MAHYKGIFDGYTLRVFNGDSVIGSIDFNRDNTVHADLYIHKERFHAGPQDESDKNIVVTHARDVLFKFKFDYLWGGAEIETNGEDSGFDVKGRWFKPGTRLTGDDATDLVLVTTSGNKLDISVSDDSVSTIMLLSTVYYHVYASAGKLRAVMMGALA